MTVMTASITRLNNDKFTPIPNYLRMHSLANVLNFDLYIVSESV